MDYEYHEAADMFPLMKGQPFTDLVESIKQRGLEVPIELFDGKIIDGRNRCRACVEAEVEPDFVEVTPDDPWGYVIALNLKRRHLDESQRAMVGARIKGHYVEAAKERQKRKPKDESVPDNCPEQNDQGEARDKAGEAVNVSGKSVDRAEKVIEKGSVALQNAVESGEVAVSTAAKLAELPKAEQTAAVKGGKAAIREAIAPPVVPPEYPASSAVVTWLTQVGFGPTKIRQDYGSLTDMVKGKEFEPSMRLHVAAMLRGAAKELASLSKEMDKLCPKQ